MSMGLYGEDPDKLKEVPEKYLTDEALCGRLERNPLICMDGKNITGLAAARIKQLQVSHSAYVKTAEASDEYYRNEVERLRERNSRLDALATQHLTQALTNGQAAQAAERKLAKVLEGLQRAVHDRVIGIQAHHDMPRIGISAKDFEDRIQAIIKEARDE